MCSPLVAGCVCDIVRRAVRGSVVGGVIGFLKWVIVACHLLMYKPSSANAGPRSSIAGS
jgi:hypothetical protein